MSRFHPSDTAVPEKWAQRRASAVIVPAGGPTEFGPQLTAPRIGLMATLLGIYFLMHVAPFAEIVVIYLHIHVPLVALMCALVTAMTVFTFRVPQFLQSPVAIPWLALLVMLFLASAFGLYPRNSLTYI